MLDRRSFVKNAAVLAALAALPVPAVSASHVRRRVSDRLAWFKASNRLMDDLPGAACYRRLYQRLTEAEYEAVLDQLNAALLIPSNARIYDASPHCAFTENCTAFRIECAEFPVALEASLLPCIEPTYCVGANGKAQFAGWHVAEVYNREALDEQARKAKALQQATPAELALAVLDKVRSDLGLCNQRELEAELRRRSDDNQGAKGS